MSRMLRRLGSSTGSRWWIWSGPGAARPSSFREFEPSRSRSVTGSGRRTAVRRSVRHDDGTVSSCAGCGVRFGGCAGAGDPLRAARPGSAGRRAGRGLPVHQSDRPSSAATMGACARRLHEQVLRLVEPTRPEVGSSPTPRNCRRSTNGSRGISLRRTSPMCDPPASCTWQLRRSRNTPARPPRVDHSPAMMAQSPSDASESGNSASRSNVLAARCGSARRRRNASSRRKPGAQREPVSGGSSAATYRSCSTGTTGSPDDLP